jgi:hypothetical protein
MDVLVTLAVTPHPLDSRTAYTVTPVMCTAWLPDDVGSGAPDPWRSSSPERQRAFENTDAFRREVRR